MNDNETFSNMKFAQVYILIHSQRASSGVGINTSPSKRPFLPHIEADVLSVQEALARFIW